MKYSIVIAYIIYNLLVECHGLFIFAEELTDVYNTVMVFLFNLALASNGLG